MTNSFEIDMGGYEYPVMDHNAESLQAAEREREAEYLAGASAEAEAAGTLSAFDDLPLVDPEDADDAERVWLTTQGKLIAQLNDAYDALKRTRISVARKAEYERERRDALDDAERDLLLSGEINGKNEEMRKAQMFNRTAVQVQQLRQAECNRRDAELHYQLASDDVQRLRALIALITLQA